MILPFDWLLLLLLAEGEEERKDDTEEESSESEGSECIVGTFVMTIIGTEGRFLIEAVDDRMFLGDRDM